MDAHVQIVESLIRDAGGSMEHGALVQALRAAGHYELPAQLVNLPIPRMVVVTEDNPRPVLMYSVNDAAG